jgi:hypothetical protein
MRKLSWQQRNENKVNRLSSRQYSMALFLERLPTRRVSWEILASMNQTTVGSFLTRGYLEERPSHGEPTVYWARAGSMALKKFSSDHFTRKVSEKLSSQFRMASS